MKTIHTQDGQIVEIKMAANLRLQNDRLVSENQTRLNNHNIKSVDIVGSVGSGKTSIIRLLVEKLSDKYRTAAIAGDITTTIDAERIREKGAEVLQINTDGGCHLDANQIKNALDLLDLGSLDLIIVENVGNLICPGGWLTGMHKRMAVVSTTEGPYMIIKHPGILLHTSVLAINKIDLADAMEVSLDQLKKDALSIKPDLKIVFTNGRTGEGIMELINALEFGV
jgi:hydrogenase nickel incorporation protein HypB